MAWESVRDDLLRQLSERIDKHSDADHQQDLHNLMAVFYGRFPPDDMRGRSVENLYGCLYGLLRFMNKWPMGSPKVRILNPEVQSHGWESRSTVLTVLCRDMPFCVASVRGELNRRGLKVHSIASCNLDTLRNKKGELLEVLAGNDNDGSNVSSESLLYFEIGRHSNVDSLEELRLTLAEILAEVTLVVEDFSAVQHKLREAMDMVRNSECVLRSHRDEAIKFLKWMGNNHITALGYEYLEVKRTDADIEVVVRDSDSLGLLRNRDTFGAQDLLSDLQGVPPEKHLRRQLSFSKSINRSRVHRLAYPDYVEIKEFGGSGEVVGQHRFIGLYTSEVYTTDPLRIPILRRKVEQVIERSGFTKDEHEGRELGRVLEIFPRDELFQSSIAELFETALAVTRIQERSQTRVFVRKDWHGKFVSSIVYIPRDRYTTEQREKIQDILSAAFDAQESEFTTHFSESILVRVHFVMRVDPAIEISYDVNELEEQIVQATLAWEDRLRLRLIEEFGEELGEQHMRELGGGFQPGYRDDFDPRVALVDLREILALKGGASLRMSLYRLLEEDDDHLKLRLYHKKNSLPLSDVLPILENLGLRVVSERPYSVTSQAGERYWVQEFSLIYALSMDINLDEVKEEFEDAFSRIWYGEAESDSFNRMLLGTRLSWREIALLRAYSRYLRQVQFPYSVEYIAETMANHLHVTAGIVELFLTRFSPVFDGDEDWRAQRELAVEGRILDSLENVENLGEDRIIRQYVTMIKATLRTNFFQQDMNGNLKPYFSFKLNPSAIPDIPKPVPMFEIFVYSPRVEGVHLRGGKVARGGLRWSDRHEDFRTEVLGLVKAQQVKNAVIVPVGAKGGFVAKQLTPGMSRDEIQAEGIACYQSFIRGLLDLTDNRTEDGVVGPDFVVAKDEEDPYLVVAADKGTATFSDIANSISAEYDFWLGDAFASGGSVGYDHKKMGITARGAWVSVQRHFREMGVNVQTTNFSVIGVGDMGGDVFGNGMLLSEHIQLLAAFNHLHIFVDPNPDPATTFAERQRLFEMPRSGWDDFNTELMSAGGGIFNRSAKSINISQEMKDRFDIKVDRLTPNELVTHLLKAEVDLLWNGGIGTYAKSSYESHTDVGDKANDSLRVNANELRCKVVGEGGNLGITQLARMEFSLRGGRSNTDFIDNAAGVDCSDHEVNIKILLNAVVARGDLTEKQRNLLLEEMTDSVSELVLQNNYRQVQAISLVEFQALDRTGEYRRFISNLVAGGKLDRALEFLPSDEEMVDRRAHGQGLTRPELSVLVSYSKAILKEDLIDSDLGKDFFLATAVLTAFPPRLISEYEEEIRNHRLHREIMCTQIANDIVNRMGLNFVARQVKATGAPIADVARAYTTVIHIFGISDIWSRIEALDHQVDSRVQMEMMLNLIRLIKRAVRWLLRNRRHQMAPTGAIEEFADGVEQLREALPNMLRGGASEQYASLVQHYIDEGVSADLASAVAGTLQGYTVLGVIQAATETDSPLLEVAELYFFMGERLELDWFSGQILSSKVENEWQAMARDTYMEDLEWQQRTLAVGVLRHMCEDRDLIKCLQAWEREEATLLQRWHEMLAELHSTDVPDFAMYAVANRELLDLAQSSLRD
ncbi:MAG: NAD-glutamate dehydrogenase [Halioglobus sp.]